MPDGNSARVGPSCAKRTAVETRHVANMEIFDSVVMHPRPQPPGDFEFDARSRRQRRLPIDFDICRLSGTALSRTNERTKGVREWMRKNRPDIKGKQVDFHRSGESVADRGRFPHRQS